MSGLERDKILNIQETSLLLRSRKRTTLLLVIILGISLLVFRQTLASALYQNLGYIHLTRDLLSPTPNRVELASAQRLFAASVSWQLRNSRARWGLGLAHHRLGEDGAAVGMWRLGEDALSRLLTLSDAAHKTEKYDESLTHALLAVQVDPNSSSAHYRLGEAHRSLGELDTALAEYERAKELNSFLPGDEADMASCYFGQARVYEGQERWDAAVWHYEAGLHMRADAAAYAGLARIYQDQFGEVATAEGYVQEAIQLDPSEGWWYVALADLYLDEQRYSEALGALQTGLALGGGVTEVASVYVRLGEVYYGLARCENAVQAYEVALTIDRHNTSAQSLLGEALKCLER